jgi:DNA topoisomerase IB
MLTKSRLLRAVGNPNGRFDRKIPPPLTTSNPHAKQRLAERKAIKSELKAVRAAKLLSQWQELHDKFADMVVRGHGVTEQARHAYALLLTMETGIRIGNEGSAEGFVCENRKVAGKDYPEKGIKQGDVIWQHPLYGQTVQTFGVTTLLHEHVEAFPDRLEFCFTGKKIVEQNLIARDPTLLAYAPTGNRKALFLGIDKVSLTKFVKRYVGRQFSPKDMRTACVNLKFVKRFARHYADAFEATATKGGRKKLIAEAIEKTAEEIGHTKSVCKSAYLSSPLLRLLSEYQPINVKS